MAALTRAGILAIALAVTPVQATIFTYTETATGGGNEIELGFPVPTPMATATAFDGFRAYDELILGLQDRALAFSEISAERLGLSLEGRDIWAFRLGDADALATDGAGAEGAVLHNGGIHAREWGSPEVMAEIIERLADNADDRGFHRYLLDNLEMLLIPVLNPDGFLQTQRHFDQVQRNLPGGAGSRDGRQRRKNMRDVDEDLATEGDALDGVDLNRNFDPFWGNGGDGNRTGITYRGTGPASEPESQRLLEAADSLPAGRLRLFIDTHSFGRCLIANETGNTRLTAITRGLATLMGRVPPGNPGCGSDCVYNYVGAPDGSGIGATDEVFAYLFNVPSYTLELEPGLSRIADEYGAAPGLGVEGGFILPESEITRVRDEVARLSLLGYYRQSGPPALRAVRITRVADGGTAYAASWQPAVGGRRLVVETPAVLSGGSEYELWLAFDRPMRVRDETGAITNYPGQTVALNPVVTLRASEPDRSFSITGDASGWQDDPARTLVYRDDAWATVFTLPVDMATAPRLWLSIAARDLASHALDANPATVADWADGHWVAYENDAGAETDTGGSDQTIVLREQETAPPPPASGGGGSGGSLGLFLALGLAALVRRRSRKA